MRQIVAATFLSLDGVMQAPGGRQEDPTGGFSHGGWTFPHWDEATGQRIGEAFGEPFDLLLGRKTYEIFAAHWPYIENHPIADAFNSVTKYVATTSDEPLTWQNSVALRGDVVGELRRLKQQGGPKLLIQGSSVLIQTLLAHDLIDVFELMIFPVLLGKGKRMFGEGTLPVGLKLERSSASRTGVVMSRYRREGDVTTGSFAPGQPSEAEIARRRKIQAEG